MTDEAKPLLVTQADRDAAAALVRVRQECAGRFSEDETVADIHPEHIEDGSGDSEDVVQAFAAHRLSAERARDAEVAALRAALEPFANPPLYVFDEDRQFVPAPMPEDWIGGGWFSTEDFRRARAAPEAKEP